ncbi:MAG: stalk domain-containing protein, partial [Bacteroidota bacterium]
TALDVAPTVKDGRTLVPLRFASEKLGAGLKWNPADRSIELTADGAGSDPAPTPAPDPAPAPPVSADDAAQKLLLAGLDLAEKSDYQGALAAYGKGLALSPSATVQAKLYFFQGYAYQQLGNKDSALASYKQALASSPTGDYGGQAKRMIDSLADAPDPAPSDSGSVAGEWRCMDYAGGLCPVGWHLTLNTDGTYKMGAEEGTWALVNGKVALKGGFPGKWDAGELYDGGSKVYFGINLSGWTMNVVFAKE